MKKLLCVSACCLLAAGFTACSDDELAGSGGYGIPASQTPLVADAGIKFPVTSYNGYRFTYENGRMTGVHNPYSEEITISFNPLVITERDDDGVIDGSVGTYKNIKVNSSGFLTYCEYNEVMYEDNDYYTYNSVISCGYDKDGHLLYIKESGTDSDGDYENGTCICTWENGNLVRTEETWFESWSDDSEPDVEVWEYTYDVEKYPNPGIYLGEHGYFDWHWLYSGLFGRPTKNIPIEECNKVSIQDGTTSWSNSWSYIPYYNEDGSVSKIDVYGNYGYGSYLFTTYYYGYADNPVRSLKKSMPEQQHKENRRQSRRLKHKKNV